MAAATLVMSLQGPNGPIKGESVIIDYEEMILIEDWKWTLDTEKDVPVPSDFSFTKKADRATVPMIQAMTAKGKDASVNLCPTAVIHLREDSMDSELELQITLTNVRITGFRLAAKVDEKSGDLDEQWTFTYSNIRFEYTSYGTLAENGKTVVFNVDAHAKGTGAPSGGAEEKILQLVPQIEGGKLDALIAKMRAASAAREKQPAEPDAHAQRKIQGKPVGAR